MSADCGAALQLGSRLVGIQERSNAYSRTTETGRVRKEPKQFLMGSLQVYELLRELKEDDQDINPAVVAAVGELLVCVSVCPLVMCA